MIDLVNGQDLTDTERRESLFRAMHTQPFFNLMTFPVATEARKRDQWADKTDVNKDFYLTEIMANFDEAHFTTDSLFNLSIYATLNQGSVYNYMQAINLPSGFIAGEARNASIAYANQRFDDRQHEYLPYLIKAGDRVIGRVANTQDKSAPFDIHLMLKGYYVTPNRYFSDNATRGINESLKNQIRFETWQELLLNTTQDAKRTVSFKNDRTARMILGFGVVDNVADGDTPNRYLIELLDTFRNITWNNRPMPIEFLGPRVGAPGQEVRDTHIYYLPVEYLWEPFSALQAEVAMASVGDTIDARLVMLTRTV